jgi:GNAT superfamily N-acetyltransferase
VQALPNVVVRVWDSRRPSADAEFARVLDLHRASKATLGLLPYPAFEEAGRLRRLVLGVIDGEVHGYVLYGTPRHHTLKLVHVCVSPDARNTGLAKAMVEFAIAANPDRSTVTAHCRSDYGIDGFWRSLDMTPSSERPGRARKGSTLTIWTRRVGPLDLLEDALYASSLPLAVLDSNVVIDLYASQDLERQDRHESLGLAEDWVVGLLDLSFSPEVEVDINGLSPAGERKRIQNSLSELVPIRRSSEMRALADSLVVRMPLVLVASDTSLSSDAKHLADAILAGADYFVTRDDNLRVATQGWIQAEFGIEVVRPAELLQRLFPSAALTEFRSDLLESVGLSWRRISASDPTVEMAFLDYPGDEKAKFFRKAVQALLARPATSRLDMLIDERGRHWALLGTDFSGDAMQVSIIRVGRGRLGSTIAFQLIRHIRALALAGAATSITVEEPSLAPMLRTAFEADGFVGDPLSARIAEHPEPAVTTQLTSAEDVAVFERANWPQIVLGREVPLWLIPIQPTYARDLIGFNDTLLLGRSKQALGLAREFVYFGAPKIKNWSLPARALWYVTKDDGAKDATAVRAVVAHSRIVDCTIVGADEAVEQYRSFGVLKEREIRARSLKTEVLVLRFEDTHVLEAPVGRRTFDQLLRAHKVNPPLRTTRSAPPRLFDEVLRLQPRYQAR